MSGTDDTELSGLFRAALAGDERSYAAFLERIAMVVRAVIRQKIRYPGFDPEDIVQEALLAIHLKRHTWQPDLPVLPWVYAIARHKLVDAIRRRNHRAETGLEGAAEPLVEPDPEPLMRRDVERALDMLSPAQRAVIAAVSVEGCSIAEAAQRLGKSETAIRVALHRGLNAISARFGRS